MDEKVILKRDIANLKRPFYLKDNIFLLYAPRNIKIEPMLNIEPILSFLTSKFREDKTNGIWSGEQCLWVEILSKSCELSIEIKKAAF